MELNKITGKKNFGQVESFTWCMEYLSAGCSKARYTSLSTPEVSSGSLLTQGLPPKLHTFPSQTVESLLGQLVPAVVNLCYPDAGLGLDYDLGLDLEGSGLEFVLPDCVAESATAGQLGGWLLHSLMAPLVA